MRFFNGTIPDLILQNVTELLQPFCAEELNKDDVREALVQFQRPLLTVAEFAFMTNCSRRTIYRAIRKGQIEFVMVGNSYRIRKDQFFVYTRNSKDERQSKQGD